jgi:hypothetical protein
MHESLALRIDVFRAFGRSLSRAVDVTSTGPCRFSPSKIGMGRT